MNDAEKRVLTVTCFSHFLSHFNVLVFTAVVLPLVDRTGLPVDRVLGLSFWMYLLFGISALPWGMIGDRFGAKRLMMVFLVGSGLSGLAAASWIDSPALFSVALGGIGLFSGIYHPIGLGLISKTVERVSLAMGYNGMWGSLGLAVAPLLAGLANFLAGPAAAFVMLGGLNLLGAVMLLVMPIEEPPREAAVNTRQSDDHGQVQAFIILLVGMMLAGVAYRGATVIMPTYFELQGPGIFQTLTGLFPGGLSPNLVATVIASGVYVMGILAQWVGGMIGDRYEARWSYFAFHAVSVPAAVLVAFFLDLPMVLLALLYMFCLLGMQPVENTLVATFSPRKFHHSAYGAKFTLVFGVGATAVPLLGWIENTWEMTAIYPALGGISALMALTILLLISRTGPVKR